MINKFDRVVINSDYKHFGSTIQNGTIGTVRDFVANDLAIIQYDYDEKLNEVVCVGLPVGILERATLEHLNDVKEYKCLVPKMYQIGNYFMLEQGNESGLLGEILEVNLAINEHDDRITLKFGTEIKTFARDYLDQFGSLMFTGNSEQVENQEELLTSDKNDLSKEEQNSTCNNCSKPVQRTNHTESGISVVINGQTFVISGDNQTISCKFNKRQLPDIIEAINVLNGLINN